MLCASHSTILKCLLLALAVAAPLASQDQQIGEMFIGYSLTAFDRASTTPADVGTFRASRQFFHGAAVSFSMNVHRRLRIVLGEFAWQTHASGLDLSRYWRLDVLDLPSNKARLNNYQFLSGPELLWNRRKMTLFARLLAGIAATHLETPSGVAGDPNHVLLVDVGFAAGIGAGAQVRLRPRVALRFLQIDYIPSRMNRAPFQIGGYILTPLSSWQHTWRYQAGIAFGL